MRATIHYLISMCVAACISLHAFAADPGTEYHLAWQDEFDQLSLDKTSNPARWGTYFYAWNIRTLSGNSDQQVWFADENILKPGGQQVRDVLRADGRWGSPARFLHEVSNGTLKLRGYPLNDTAKPLFGNAPYVAGMISGEKTYAQAYGYWEVRFRINAIGKGHHLAIWMDAANNVWPPEIDLLEVVGTQPTTFTANCHDRNKLSPKITSYSEPSTTDGWHVVGFEWTPTLMRWTMDGHVVREHGDLVGNVPMYFLITWEIGSKWPGLPDSTTPWPAEVEIDYVRVYQ